MIKKLLIRLLLRLLDFSVDYRKIDRKAFEEWAFRSVDSVGWKSYFAYEDLKVLKSLGQGQEGIHYWINIGRRIQLLSLADEMRKVFELRTSEREKKQPEAIKK